MKHTPDRHALARAAEGAAAALRAMQRPSGELPTCESPTPDMASARPYGASVYTTTFAVHALRRLAGLPAAAEALAAAAAHLRAERNPDGSWSYEGRGTTRVPPDLDDTACAAAALCALGERPDLRFFRLLWTNEAAPGGPYYTWVGVNAGEHLLARQVDALVNANVIFCAALAGLALPGAAAYLRDCIAAGDLTPASDYCLTPHLLVYALARALADGPARELAPATPALLRHARALDTGEPLRLACAAAALLALGDTRAARPLLGDLLAAQGAGGGWPIGLAYAGYPPHFAGSPGLTTSIALDAIGRAL